MHIFRILPVLSLLFGARASYLDSRGAIPHPLDVRQAADVCATVNAELVVPNKQGVPTHVGMIDTCLCLSTIPTFIQSNAVAIRAVTIAGQLEVTNILTQLVVSAAASQNCPHPDHSIPTCDGKGNSCGFQCTDGFTPHPPGNPTTCVCQPPSVVCNGKCVARGTCPSQHATKKKRWVGSGSCAERGPGWAACGVLGGGARAWECVNIARDLESCGGCVFPLSAYSPIGVDCTALPGVADVACVSGKCVVHRCLRDYVSTHDGARCNPEYPKISQPDIDGAEDDIEIEFVPARIFGLEHNPL